MYTNTMNQRYTIREAAGIVGLPETTLRYYERIGLLAPVKRDASSKHRTFSEADLMRAVTLACLSDTGMGVDEMRLYVKNLESGARASPDQLALLELQRERLAVQMQLLAQRQRYVEAKIAYWQAYTTGDDAAIQAAGEHADSIAREMKAFRRKVKRMPESTGTLDPSIK